MNNGLKDLFRLEKTRVEPASQILARAFQDHPLFIYCLPEADQRARLSAYIFAVIVRYGVIYGEAYATSERLEGVSVWHPPGKTEMSLWATVQCGGLSLLSKVGPKVIARVETCEKYAAKLQRRYAGFPHWYLSPLGVDPLFQGKGYASTLLKAMLNRLDEEGLPCYLETHKLTNVNIYQRHGFKVVGTDIIPGTDINLWCMLRDKS